MISRNGKAAAPENYTFIKHFTPTHFIWTLVDPQGNIINGAGGPYTLKCNTLTTIINQVLPGMKSFYNSKNESEISVNASHAFCTSRTDTPELFCKNKMARMFSHPGHSSHLN